MEKFKRDGYLILEGLFTEKEVMEMKAAGQKLAENIPPKEERVIFSSTKQSQSTSKYFLESGDKVSYFFENGALDENGDLVVNPLKALNKVGHYLHALHPVFQKFTYSERIREICFRLGMQDPAILQSMVIYKNPGVGSEVTPHQDATFLHSVPEDRLLGFWIALDDATLENGCLWFLPGSHKSGVHSRFIRNPDKQSEQLLIFNSPSPNYPTSSFVAAPVTKGSCVLIHGLVVHKSEKNNSADSRHAFTFHVADFKDMEYSRNNWLQPPTGSQFPRLYSQPQSISTST